MKNEHAKIEVVDARHGGDMVFIGKSLAGGAGLLREQPWRTRGPRSTVGMREVGDYTLDEVLAV